MKEGLSKDICQHVLGRDVVELNLLVFNAFSNKIMINIDVLGIRVEYWVIS